MTKKTVSVYGYGRFGKFWADILSEDFNVKAYSRRGLKPEEVSPGTIISDERDIYNCDAIFFCVAISSFEKLLADSKQYFKKDTLFFDTCSVKVNPAKWMTDHIPSENPIIATHPMFGPDSYNCSDCNLPMVMCNISADQDTFNEWSEYFSDKRMKVESMTPDEHDKKVAYSQGITHFIGRVLSDLNLEPGNIDTLGYEKLLEIIEQTCNDNFQLFIDLQKFNPYTNAMRDELKASLDKIYSSFEK